MTSRERILARRSQLVAAALAMSGCRSPQPAPAPAIVSTTADAGATVDASPEVAGRPMPCLSIIAPSTIAITARIYFAEGSAKLDPASLPVLDALAEALLEHPLLEVEVRGHVDAGEPPSVALGRARAVRDYLVKKGVDSARLTMRDLGETAPSEKPPNEKNRYVDFELTKQ